jgi:ribosomal protein L37AE/L43A
MEASFKIVREAKYEMNCPVCNKVSWTHRRKYAKVWIQTHQLCESITSHPTVSPPANAEGEAE